MKLTFKSKKPTGKWKSFNRTTHYVKLDKKQIGQINDKTFKIMLMVTKKDIMEDGNPNCSWMWITLKKESKSLEEAQTFLTEHIEEISTKHNLHKSED